MALLVSAQAALLQELARGPGWNDGLRRRLRERTLGAVDLSRGNVTAAVDALLAAGLLEPAGEEPRADLGGTPRRLYRLTATGRAEAERQRGVVLAVFGEAAATADAASPAARGGAVPVQPKPPPAPQDDEPPAERWVEREEP